MANRLTGNGRGNVLKGRDGSDTLSGQDGQDTLDGGAGEDRVTCGLGNDCFHLPCPLEAHGPVTDLRNGSGNNDVLRDVASGFDGLVAGQPTSPELLRIGTGNVALRPDNRFIFRTTDRTLWWDQDGLDGAGPVLLADLQAGASVTAADLLVA